MSRMTRNTGRERRMEAGSGAQCRRGIDNVEGSKVTHNLEEEEYTR